MHGTIQLEDMRLFAAVAEAKSFTAAARVIAVPKQTLSRRVAALESALGTQLMVRTTRRLQLTTAGAQYAARCAEIVRAAQDANTAVVEADETPRGLLRITADPVFGDEFVTGLVVEYAKRWPETRLQVELTRRRVDLIEERFDAAFRIGQVDDATLVGTRLGPARVRYCASPGYVKKRGLPKRPDDLDAHDCIVVASDGDSPRWPFITRRGLGLVHVSGRISVSSFVMARAAVLAGLGIGIFPEFACAADIRDRRIVPVLGAHPIEVGSIWMLRPAGRVVPARTRALLDLARARLKRS